jgi:Ca2+-binding EF-hand superfamily protein
VAFVSYLVLMLPLGLMALVWYLTCRPGAGEAESAYAASDAKRGAFAAAVTRQVQAIFHEIDKDGSGTIDRKELAAKLKADGELEALLGEADAKGIREVVALLRKLEEGKVLDADGDSKISLDEFERAVERAAAATPQYERTSTAAVVGDARNAHHLGSESRQPLLPTAAERSDSSGAPSTSAVSQLAAVGRTLALSMAGASGAAGALVGTMVGGMMRGGRGEWEERHAVAAAPLVSREEDMARQLRTRLARDFPTAVFAAWDADKPPRARGKTTKDEFRRAVSMLPLDADEEPYEPSIIDALFESFDAEGKGMIAPATMAEALKAEQPSRRGGSVATSVTFSAPSGRGSSRSVRSSSGAAAAAARTAPKEPGGDAWAAVEQESMAALLQQQQEDRDASAARRAEEDAKRRDRLTKYEAGLVSMWDSQWAYVQLHSLPHDILVDGCGVAEREPQLKEQLGALLRTHFQPLFDMYLHYAKIDEDEYASELYRMTESSWKTLLRDATVLGTAPGQISSVQASQIFTNVNQRREHLELAGLGGGWGLIAAAGETIVEHGYAYGVVRAHYAAGSLFAFTFSECLEGLVLLALELEPTQPFTASSVLASVSRLLETKLLPHDAALDKRYGDVLGFRRMVLGSTLLSEALTAVRPLLEPLHLKYGLKPGEGGAPMNTPAGALGIRQFYDMCSDARLAGADLSRNAIKQAFVNSLPFSDDTAADRKPLLRRGVEFDEALVRLARAYTGKPLSASAVKRGVKRGGTFTDAKAAERAGHALYTAIESQVGAQDELPVGLEAELLGKLPVVCGKLLATVKTAPAHALPPSLESHSKPPPVPTRHPSKPQTPKRVAETPKRAAAAPEGASARNPDQVVERAFRKHNVGSMPNPDWDASKDQGNSDKDYTA